MFLGFVDLYYYKVWLWTSLLRCLDLIILWIQMFPFLCSNLVVIILMLYEPINLLNFLKLSCEWWISLPHIYITWLFLISVMSYLCLLVKGFLMCLGCVKFCDLFALHFQVVVNRYKRTISEVNQMPESPTTTFQPFDDDSSSLDDIPQSK